MRRWLMSPEACRSLAGFAGVTFEVDVKQEHSRARQGNAHEVAQQQANGDDLNGRIYTVRNYLMGLCGSKDAGGEYGRARPSALGVGEHADFDPRAP